VCDIELRVDMLAAVFWVRYLTASGYVSSSVFGAILNCEWIS